MDTRTCEERVHSTREAKERLQKGSKRDDRGVLKWYEYEK
jgi:hypothetical protein